VRTVAVLRALFTMETSKLARVGFNVSDALALVDTVARSSAHAALTRTSPSIKTM
jgi:hypothetical protein